MSLINRTLISMLAEIRQKNLFVFVVMPCFFDLDKYVALWRSRVLIHVYTDGFKRGYFCFYNVDKKKELYMLGKKFYAYGKPKCNFYGRFTDYYVIDETAYRLKKKNSLLEREKKSAELEKNKEVQDLLFSKLQDMKTMDHPTRMNILGMTHGAYFYKLKAYEDGKLEDTI